MEDQWVQDLVMVHRDQVQTVQWGFMVGLLHHLKELDAIDLVVMNNLVSHSWFEIFVLKLLLLTWNMRSVVLET